MGADGIELEHAPIEFADEPEDKHHGDNHHEKANGPQLNTFKDIWSHLVAKCETDE